jgi:hypothetical protein
MTMESSTNLFAFARATGASAPGRKVTINCRVRMAGVQRLLVLSVLISHPDSSHNTCIEEPTDMRLKELLQLHDPGNELLEHTSRHSATCTASPSELTDTFGTPPLLQYQQLPP